MARLFFYRLKLKMLCTLITYLHILDPHILKFLQQKRQTSTSTTGTSSKLCEDDEGIGAILVDDVTTEGIQQHSMSQSKGNGLVDVGKDALGTNVSEKWLHMDRVENEKLEWMKKPPNVKKSGVC